MPETTPATTPSCPVIDFDHHAPELALDPWARYKEMREQCPVAHTEAWGGFKVVTRYDDVVAIAKDTGTWSSAHDIDGTGNGYQGITIPSPPVRSIPVELDPPEHTKYRKLLTQVFSPAATESRRARIEEICNGFVDAVTARGECDLVDDIATPIPAAVTLEILGMPIEKWERYALADAHHRLRDARHPGLRRRDRGPRLDHGGRARGDRASTE